MVAESRECLLRKETGEFSDLDLRVKYLISMFRGGGIKTDSMAAAGAAHRMRPCRV
jgi:hypothetical protein